MDKFASNTFDIQICSRVALNSTFIEKKLDCIKASQVCTLAAPVPSAAKHLRDWSAQVLPRRFEKLLDYRMFRWAQHRPVRSLPPRQIPGHVHMKASSCKDFIQFTTNKGKSLIEALSNYKRNLVQKCLKEEDWVASLSIGKHSLIRRSTELLGKITLV